MSATVALFRETLKHAAANYAPKYPEDCEELTTLCKAAAAYAEARLASAGVKTAAPKRIEGASGAVVPFGKHKGEPIETATDKDLAYLSTAMQRSIDDPTKERWRESNAKLKAAIDAELSTRGAL